MDKARLITIVLTFCILCLSLLWWWWKVKNVPKSVKIKENDEQGGESKALEWKAFKIFLGSPSGLESEREAFCREVELYNTTEANPRNIHFCVVKWEDIPSAYGRPQSIINVDLVDCHCYILMLWERWGTPTGGGNGNGYESGSEEEYKLAVRCLKNKEMVMSKIGVYFKRVDEHKKREPDEEKQLEKVSEFREEIKEEHTLKFNEFDGLDEFRELVRSYLARWVLDETGWRKPKGIHSVLDYEEPEKSFRVR